MSWFRYFCALLFLLLLLPKGEMQTPTITAAPSSPQTVLEGQSITLEWTYNLSGRSYLQMQLSTTIDGVLTNFQKHSSVANLLIVPPSVDYVGRITANVTDTFTTISIIPVKATDSRTYTFTIQNDLGAVPTTPSVMKIEVLVPASLTFRAPDQVLVEGDPATFSLSCSASGGPTPHITWTKVFENGSDSEVLFEAPSSPFVLSNNRNNEGTYRCTANNGVGSPVNHTVRVTVNFKPENVQFNVQSNDANICRGESVNFTCSASGKPPVDSYQLFANDSLVSGDSNAGFWSQTLSTEGVFIYRCEANNTVGRTNTSRTVPVNEPSSIQAIPKQTIIELGNLTVTCEASGIPAPSGSWVKVGSNQHTNGNKLVLTNISRSQAGEYRCEATNPCGNTSESVTVDVQYPPGNVRLQTSEEKTCFNSAIRLNCSADANPMVHTYQLYENDTLVNEGSSSGVWSRTMSTAGLFFYKCMVNNTLGTESSSTVSVLVNVPSSVDTIQNQTLTEGDRLTLTCQASGIPPPSVSWIRVGDGQLTNSNGLVFTSINRSEAGEYRCEASNECGNASESAVIVVQFPPENVQLSVREPRICRGSVITFNCSAYAVPMVNNYQLHENGSLVNQSSSSGVWNRTMSSAGVFVYQCMVANSIGPANSTVLTVTVNVPSSIDAIENKTLNEGDGLNLTCQASGIPLPSVSWVRVSDGQRTNSNELVFTSINRSEAGEYRCEASNECGNASESAVIVVQFPPENVHLSVGETTICLGTVITFNCSAYAVPMVNNYQLYENGSLVNESSSSGVWSRTMSAGVFVYQCMVANSIGTANSTMVTVTVNVLSSIYAIENKTLIEGNSSTLTCLASGIPPPSVSWIRLSDGQRTNSNEFVFTNITRREAGEYRCEASNECGNASESAVVVVNYPPEITSISGPQTTDNGDTLTLNCTADGNPAPTITWTKLPDNSVTMPLMITKQSEGRYRCTAHNGIGSAVTSETSIVVQFPPSIIPLENKIVQRGDSITLFCDVSGNPTPSVSWTQLSTGIKLYSKKWIISNTDVKDLGEYRCEAVNIHGNDSDTMAISYEGGKCEVKCINGKQCRFFGRYLCLCERGMKGENCTQSERLRTILIAGLVFPNEEFKAQYEDLENRETVRFADEVNNAFIEEFKGSGLVLAMVTRLRKGSVITDVELTFNHTVGESEVNNLMKEVTKDGKLGEFEVSEVLVGSVIKDEDPSEPEKTNKDVIYGPVIGVLAVILILVAVYFLIKQRRQKSYGQDKNPEEMSGPHFNEGNDTSENDADAAVSSQYMELREVATNAQGRPTEISPYSEIHDYAPLHPGTLSWEVERENVVIEKVIGKGAFGQVAQGKASELRGREGTFTVAIKMLKANARGTDRKDLLSELEIMKTLKPHPHVIKLLGCVTGSDPILVIIEYVPYGDLLGYLKKSRGLNDTYYKDPDVKPQTSLTSLQLMKFSWEVADGMSYLSSRNIIHRDLAARNVLVGEGETCKVTDFGMARNVQQENIYERKTKGRIPVKWTAYEALMYRRYTTKSDVWSFGIVLYEIFTIGGSPYPRTDARKLADLLVQGYRMPKPSHLDDALYQIMFNCWQEDPADRPTFQDLRRELKRMENQHKRLINMETYDKKLYENV